MEIVPVDAKQKEKKRVYEPNLVNVSALIVHRNNYTLLRTMQVSERATDPFYQLDIWQMMVIIFLTYFTLLKR